MCIRDRFQEGLGYTPTPVISHAILTFNRAHPGLLADGVVITPSHNPPTDGGFKYNPPSGGPADPEITGLIQARANAIIADGLRAWICLLYTSPSPRDRTRSRMPSYA